jgi:catechol-2,3-dioxygenase
VIRPAFHHVNLKTTRLQEMIDFYRELVGAEVIHQDAVGAWLSNDGANHRIALLAFPNFSDDPEKDAHTGMHHSAFEYASFEELNASYLRLKEAGITPPLCLDHGMTLSYYYADPDGNNVELQVDCFGDWRKSKEWMRTSDEFKANPIGVFVEPDRIAADHAAGMSFAEIHAKAMAGGYAPEQAPVEIPEMSP